MAKRVGKIRVKAPESGPPAPVESPVSEKKYRVCLPVNGTLMSYATAVLGRRVKFVKGKTYLVNLRDAKLLKQQELLPGRKIFVISEVIPELEDDTEAVALEEVPEASASETIDLTVA